MIRRRFAVLIMLLAGTVIPHDAFGLTNGIAELEETALTIKNEAVYFNLGIEYLNRNDIGHAVLNLKRAHLLNPYDSEIASALSAARESIGIPAYFFEASPLERVIQFPLTVFALPAMAAIGIVLFAAGSAGLSLGLARIVEMLRARVWRIVSIVLMALGAVYLAGAYVRYGAMFDPAMGVAVYSGTVADRPDATALEKKDIAAGIECRIENEIDGYYFITTIDGKEGWTALTNIARVWK